MRPRSRLLREQVQGRHRGADAGPARDARLQAHRRALDGPALRQRGLRLRRRDRARRHRHADARRSSATSAATTVTAEHPQAGVVPVLHRQPRRRAQGLRALRQGTATASPTTGTPRSRWASTPTGWSTASADLADGTADDVIAPSDAKALADNAHVVALPELAKHHLTEKDGEGGQDDPMTLKDHPYFGKIDKGSARARCAGTRSRSASFVRLDGGAQGPGAAVAPTAADPGRRHHRRAARPTAGGRVTDSRPRARAAKARWRRRGEPGRRPRIRPASGRADDREDLGAAEDLTGHVAHLLDGDRVDAPHHLVDAEQLVVDQLGLADARHPGRRSPRARAPVRRAADPCRGPAPRR